MHAVFTQILVPKFKSHNHHDHNKKYWLRKHIFSVSINQLMTDTSGFNVYVINDFTFTGIYFPLLVSSLLSALRNHTLLSQFEQ